ncbi:MAG: COG2426 family protein [Lachnospiraceae bacterium]
MQDILIDWFTQNLGTILPREAVIFIISMVPILELRGGLIAAALLKVPLFSAIVICIIGNLLPIPFILLLITKIFSWLKQLPVFHKYIVKLEKHALGKSDRIQKYEFIGLMLFVGIPLPGTGAWTGALIASLLDIPFKKSFAAIITGVLVATVIMCTITYGIPYLIQLF